MVSTSASHANEPGSTPVLGIADVDTVCCGTLWIQSFGRDVKPVPRHGKNPTVERTLNAHITLPYLTSFSSSSFTYFGFLVL